MTDGAPLSYIADRRGFPSARIFPQQLTLDVEDEEGAQLPRKPLRHEGRHVQPRGVLRVAVNLVEGEAAVVPRLALEGGPVELLPAVHERVVGRLADVDEVAGEGVGAAGRRVIEQREQVDAREMSVLRQVAVGPGGPRSEGDQRFF